MHTKSKTSGPLRAVLRVLLLIIAVLAAVFFIYTGSYYHAGSTASGLMKHADSHNVKIKQVSDGWLFDGPGTKTAVIFYPGAKVQSEAYAPVLYRIAQNGSDCFLMKMPFHLAIFGKNKAEHVIKQYPGYRHWYMAGHSLGGAMAGNFTSDHSNQVDGVIFLAAYPTKSLKKQDLLALSIYGSKDRVLNREHYRKDLSLMPDRFTEVVISGGNHGGFGDYGHQKKDGTAAITPDKQWDQTAAAVNRFLSGAADAS